MTDGEIDSEGTGRSIGLLNERPLHAALKQWYARPGDRFEVPVDGYVVDIVRDGLLLEIQTGGFSAIRPKLVALLDNHTVRLVHPVPLEKWIIKLPPNGLDEPSRRKSPKRGRVEEVFTELVSLPRMLTRPGFSLEVLLTREEEVRSYDGRRGWRRRGWVIEERRLLEVAERYTFTVASDIVSLLPEGLKRPFTTADLAESAGLRRALAQKMAYCMHRSGLVERVGKRGRSWLYG